MNQLLDNIQNRPENSIFAIVFFPDRIYHAQYLNATRSSRYRYYVHEVRNSLDNMVMKGLVFLDGNLLARFLRIEYRASRLVEQAREQSRFLRDCVLADVGVVHRDPAKNSRATVRLHFDNWIDGIAARGGPAARNPVIGAAKVPDILLLEILLIVLLRNVDDVPGVAGRAVHLKKAGQPPYAGIDVLRGSDNQLKALVDLCHVYGMAVIFDVVYNHAGGGFDENSMWFLDRMPYGNLNDSLYFTDKGWAGGEVFAYWNDGVKQFLIDNAKSFYEEYRIDGLRFDEVSVMDQFGGWLTCQDMTETPCCHGAGVDVARDSAAFHGPGVPGRQAMERHPEPGK